MRRNDASLSDQFVCLDRQFVHDGRWARLWRRGAGEGVSVAPVVTLLASGRGVTLERPRRVAALSGIPMSQMTAARRALVRSGVADFLPCHRGHWCFQSSIVFAARPGARNRFYFRGRLLENGHWASFPSATKCLLITLAACAKAQVRVDTDEMVDASQPWDECPDWLWHHDDEELIPLMGREEPVRILRRMGCVSLNELTSLCGFTKDAFEAAFEGLLAVDTAHPPIYYEIADDRLWYQLPDDFWAPPCRSERG